MPSLGLSTLNRSRYIPLWLGNCHWPRSLEDARLCAWLDALPLVAVASDSEVRLLVERRRLAGRDIGWVDAHLLASALISHSDLWTTDGRLGVVAAEIGVLGLSPLP